MSAYDSRTIILRGKNIKENKITTTDQLETKFGAKKNTQSVIPYAKKIEEAIEQGTASVPPKIPKELSQLIQKTRIEKGYETQKKFAVAVTSPNVTSNEIQQMESGQMILNPQNRHKIQAVGRLLQLGPLNLPKIA
jgi:hypothetical protein